MLIRRAQMGSPHELRSLQMKRPHQDLKRLQSQEMKTPTPRLIKTKSERSLVQRQMKKKKIPRKLQSQRMTCCQSQVQVADSQETAETPRKTIMLKDQMPMKPNNC